MNATWLVVLLAIGCSHTPLAAQEIRVKIVDGRNGKPVGHSCVNIWVGERQKSPFAIPTDEDGVARLRLTEIAGDVDIGSHWAACGMFGVLHPVVMYSDTLRINVGYAWCDPRIKTKSWLTIRMFPTRDLIADGEGTPNACGKTAGAVLSPGEITIYVRPLTFWEKLGQ